MLTRVRVVIHVPVLYDPEVTDPEALAKALDTLLETATSTPGILEDYGDPEILPTELSKCTEIDMLESLLSLTESFKSQMDSASLHEWQRISAETADRRLTQSGCDENGD